MKASIKLAALACALSGANAAPEKAEKRAGCNADNCLRAIAITRLGEATRQLRLYDCSSFLQATVTPAATYVITNLRLSTMATSYLRPTQPIQNHRHYLNGNDHRHLRGRQHCPEQA